MTPARRCDRCDRRSTTTAQTTFSVEARNLVSWLLCERCRDEVRLAIVRPVRGQA